jgi:hypothetical protein
VGLTLIVCITILVIVSLVLWLVDRLRPRAFKIKATVTKWVSFDVEIESPQDVSRSS